MSDGPLKTRFAPSPTGYLHLGHAASAWHVWQWAERLGATVELRIEDIDTTRCRPEFTDAILEDLAWLGFSWERPVRIQSEHFDDYQSVVDALASKGLAYRCFLSRKQLAERFESGAPVFTEPLAPAEEADRLAKGDPFAWRLDLKAAKAHLGSAWDELAYLEQVPNGVISRRAFPDRHGNIVLARKDSPSAYHVAATHDDALQNITHVVRGRDLEDAPHIQVLLQTLLGWPPVTYVHHDLVLGEDGKRLSKSNNSVSLRDLRASGLQPQDIWRRLELQ